MRHSFETVVFALRNLVSRTGRSLLVSHDLLSFPDSQGFAILIVNELPALGTGWRPEIVYSFQARFVILSTNCDKLPGSGDLLASSAIHTLA